MSIIERALGLMFCVVWIRWTPHPVIVAIRIRIRLGSYYIPNIPLLQGGGVLRRYGLHCFTGLPTSPLCYSPVPLAQAYLVASTQHGPPKLL